MKVKLIFISFLSLCLLSSCIKEEAQNSEADILSFDLPEDLVFGKAQISNDKVILFVNRGADISDVSPSIEVTKGAKIYPSPDQKFDFTKENIFVITSEDGVYSKPYSVEAVSTFDYHFNFEDWKADDALKRYPELTDGLWKSGNSGLFMMPPMAQPKYPYPTYYTDDCVEGEKALCLETLQGKEVFNDLYALFSGSLFYGVFTLKQGAEESPKGVLFGHPHPKSEGRPVRITGYYKYKPGPIYTDKEQNPVPGKVDEFTIRAFLYKVRIGAETGSWKGQDYLTGKDDILNSPQVVGIADMKDCSAKENFTYFDLKFEYRLPIDYTQNDYRLAIVFSSSKNGDFYEGAVGSKLIVDDVRVICEEFKD